MDIDEDPAEDTVARAMRHLTKEANRVEIFEHD
jgi:hypothetical protein